MTLPTAVVIGVGAERGLGAALCRRFASAGHHVLVAGRTPGKIEQVARAITSSGDSAAEAYWQIHRKHRSAWTHELDLRPFKEPF